MITFGSVGPTSVIMLMNDPTEPRPSTAMEKASRRYLRRDNYFPQIPSPMKPMTSTTKPTGPQIFNVGVLIAAGELPPVRSRPAPRSESPVPKEPFAK